MEREREDDVFIFWDHENCSVQRAIVGYDVAHNIRDVAQQYGIIKSFKAYLEVSVNASPTKNSTFRAELQSSGVTLIDCPHNGRKEVVDKMMLVDLIMHACDTRPRTTVVLITGDRDFAYGIAICRFRKHRVILIAPSTAHHTLTAQATEWMDWNVTIMGGPQTNGANGSSGVGGQTSRPPSTAPNASITNPPRQLINQPPRPRSSFGGGAGSNMSTPLMAGRQESNDHIDDFHLNNTSTNTSQTTATVGNTLPLASGRLRARRGSVLAPDPQRGVAFSDPFVGFAKTLDLAQVQQQHLGLGTSVPAVMLTPDKDKARLIEDDDLLSSSRTLTTGRRSESPTELMMNRKSRGGSPTLGSAIRWRSTSPHYTRSRSPSPVPFWVDRTPRHVPVPPPNVGDQPRGSSIDREANNTSLPLKGSPSSAVIDIVGASALEAGHYRSSAASTEEWGSRLLRLATPITISRTPLPAIPASGAASTLGSPRPIASTIPTMVSNTHSRAPSVHSESHVLTPKATVTHLHPSSAIHSAVHSVAATPRATSIRLSNSPPMATFTFPPPPPPEMLDTSPPRSRYGGTPTRNFQSPDLASPPRGFGAGLPRSSSRSSSSSSSSSSSTSAAPTIQPNGENTLNSAVMFNSSVPAIPDLKPKGSQPELGAANMSTTVNGSTFMVVNKTPATFIATVPAAKPASATQAVNKPTSVPVVAPKQLVKRTAAAAPTPSTPTTKPVAGPSNSIALPTKYRELVNILQRELKDGYTQIRRDMVCSGLAPSLKGTSVRPGVFLEQAGVEGIVINSGKANDQWVELTPQYRGAVSFY